mmetsp:Transcript_64473/g.209227  ORF Transcript_64473/g.209227 Transcript_64473/m.209227 type:complete len:387 (+) Transcript_64473:635-1795(+)
MLVVQLAGHGGDAHPGEGALLAELPEVADHNRHVLLRGLALGHAFGKNPGVLQDLRAGQAHRGVELQQRLQELLRLLRNLLPWREAGEPEALGVRGGQVLRRRSVEGRLSTEHDIGQDAQAPQIACLCVGRGASCLNDLRRSIHEAADGRHHGSTDEAHRQAPVDDFDQCVLRVLRAVDNVLRLYVSVRNASAVRVGQGRGHLRNDVGSGLLGDAAHLHYALEDLSTLAELHDEEHVPLLLEGAQQLADVGVVQVLHHIYLPQKVLVGRHLAILGDLLHSHLLVLELPIPGDEDLAVASLSELHPVQIVPHPDVDVEPLRKEVPVTQVHGGPALPRGRASRGFSHRRLARARLALALRELLLDRVSASRRQGYAQGRILLDSLHNG